MPTKNQVSHKLKTRINRFHKGSRAKALLECPHKKGVCTKVTVMKPKKPNSATRRIAKVKLSTGRKVKCYIKGKGSNLREYSQVFVEGGGVPDLPGIQYHLVKGKFDFSYEENWEDDITRTNARSKYGIPRNKLK